MKSFQTRSKASFDVEAVFWDCLFSLQTRLSLSLSLSLLVSSERPKSYRRFFGDLNGYLLY